MEYCKCVSVCVCRGMHKISQEDQGNANERAWIRICCSFSFMFYVTHRVRKMVTSKNLSLPQTMCRMDWSRKIAVYIFVSFYMVAKCVLQQKPHTSFAIVYDIRCSHDNALLQNAIGAFYSNSSSNVCVCKMGIVFFLFCFVFLFTPKFCSNIYFSHTSMNFPLIEPTDRHETILHIISDFIFNISI